MFLKQQKHLEYKRSHTRNEVYNYSSVIEEQLLDQESNSLAKALMRGSTEPGAGSLATGVFFLFNNNQFLKVMNEQEVSHTLQKNISGTSMHKFPATADLNS